METKKGRKGEGVRRREEVRSKKLAKMRVRRPIVSVVMKPEVKQ